MQQRHPDAKFAGGAWVFPGGKLDPEDQDKGWLEPPHWPAEVDATSALATLANPPRSAAFNAPFLPTEDLSAAPEVAAHAFWVAAIRETYEEAGILLTSEGYGMGSEDSQAQSNHTEIYRQLLLDQQITFRELLTQTQQALAIDQLHYLCRWITPRGNVRRYDARFFIALAPPHQEPSHDDYEAVDTRWINPLTALDAYRAREISLILPTLTSLAAMHAVQATSAQQLIHAMIEWYTHTDPREPNLHV